jgi:hypothetical protein
MTKPYNLRSIRQLVTSAYNLEELRQLCYEVPEFRPVYDNFGEERKDGLVRHLIEHCERKGYLDRLLAIIEEDVPEMYAEFAGKLNKGRTAPSSSATPRPVETVPDLDLQAVEIEQTKKLIIQKTRQLHALQLKEATYGLATPPHVQIEIEDLEKEITELKQKLTDLSS